MNCLAHSSPLKFHPLARFDRSFGDYTFRDVSNVISFLTQNYVRSSGQLEPLSSWHSKLVIICVIVQ